MKPGTIMASLDSLPENNPFVEYVTARTPGAAARRATRSIASSFMLLML